MMEYTLVFRRMAEPAASAPGTACPWIVVRPASTPARRRRAARRVQTERPGAITHLAHVFFVPIWSALDMDIALYDRFLVECGAVAAALNVLASMSVQAPDDAEIVRKEIAALVMAAEVQHIVDQLSA